MKKQYVLLVVGVWLMMPGLATAQDKEQARQYMEQAEMMMAATQAMDDARELLVMAANMDTTSVEANFKAGYYHMQTIGKDKAATFFLRVYRQQPSFRFDLEYWIGKSYQHGLAFDQAIDYYTRYKQKLLAQPAYKGEDRIAIAEVTRRLEECATGKELVARPGLFTVTNIGGQVNSEFDDYSPVVDADESLMIFTTRRRDGNSNENVANDNEPFEDIFVASRKNETWGSAKNAGTPLNTRYHDSNIFLSADGKTLFIRKDVNEGDIFYSTRNADGLWSAPTALPRVINSPYSEFSVCLSADGTTLYFSSDRPGGKGGVDIYRCTKNKKGEWANVKNLTAINTPADEDGPFLDYEGNVLYFSSTGGKGMGGYDLFRSVWNESAKTWGAPENMGYPVNTPDNDIYLVGTREKNRWYYSSVREGGMGYTDIYLITARDTTSNTITKAAAKKSRQLILKMIDATTGAAVNAKVVVRTKTDKLATVSLGEPGFYELDLPDSTSHSYRITAESPGHVFVNRAIMVEAGTGDVVYVIKMIPLVVGESIILRNIYFEVNAATLTAESNDELDLLEEMMEVNPTLVIEIAGHTDDMGNHDFNMDLSQRRANAVKKYLTDKNIPDNRIRA
ncbi:MAG: OmpA family protein, partial [Cyclobacteriaceae bacterium]|nr:OmpA family protein [Cyclobacteriaceae bacterium]